jgi:hypothetical protein
MFSNGLFSLGYAGPLLLLFLGSAVIGLVFSGAAIVARRRAAPEAAQGELQSNIDLAIGILVVSGPLSFVGFAINYYWASKVGIMLAIVAVFILWPLSAFLAFRARGVGRKEILIGSGLIGLWVLGLLVIMAIH